MNLSPYLQLLYRSSSRDPIAAAQQQGLYRCNSRDSIAAAAGILSPQEQGFYHRSSRDSLIISITAAAVTTISRERYPHGSGRHSLTAAADTPTQQLQTLYHRSCRHSIIAAADTLSSQQQTLPHSSCSNNYHCNKSITAAAWASFTAAAATLSLTRQEQRLSSQQPQQGVYHVSRRDSIKTAGGALSRRQQGLYHSSSLQSISITARQQQALYHGSSGESITVAEGNLSRQ